MIRVALDSLPTVPIKIPSDVSFNVSPTYRGKRRRGQPILGQQQEKYTHFVPMGDTSPHIKKLLEIPESDRTPLKPFDGYSEILKAEKESNGEKPVVDQNVFHPDFKTDAKAYLNTPNRDRRDSYFSKEDHVPLVAKNNANLANIIAAARPKVETKAKVKPGPMPKSKPQKSLKKKKPAPMKMTSFRILEKKK